MATYIQTGLERLIEAPPEWLEGKRLGLLCNPASVNRELTHASELINTRFAGQLKAIFAPQHGFYAEKQDNMIESEDMFDPRTGLPVFSLYGETRIPTEVMFDHIDVLLIDLQDVGTRVYTFIYTMSYCLESARKYNKQVLVLDRPNPVGGEIVEGDLLSTEYASFVGRYPIPMRHGLTIGELAGLFNKHFKIDADLEILPMRGWRRHMFFEDTRLPWVPPSPNMPTPTTAIVYPGQVIWEATNISEGRGTTQPFEICGAPFIDPHLILERLAEDKGPVDLLDGVKLRPVFFEPTANKWCGQLCRGFQIHIINAASCRSYLLSLRLLQLFISLYPGKFEWKQPPYEYEFEKMPIDLIVGDKECRLEIEEQADLFNLAAAWEGRIDAFVRLSRQFYLYD